MSPAIVALLALLLGTNVAQAGLSAYHRRPSVPPQLITATDLLVDLVKHRYVVTLRGAEGDFAGILTEQQLVSTHTGATELMLVFEHCSTIPTHEGDTAADVAGRVILGLSGIAYLQQVG